MWNSKQYSRFWFFSFLVFLLSCNSNYQPKPKGYFDIKFPAEKSYQKFEDAKYPYSFEYPGYAKLLKDSTFFDASPKNDYWINVDFPNYRCKIYLSYNNVKGQSYYKVKDKITGEYKDSIGQNSFEKLRDDAFNLTSKHMYKASDIPKEKITTPNGISGMLFKVGGNAASPVQFFLTDTANHFIRGALYYEAVPNADSTRPITNFLMSDIKQLINTLQWKK